MPVTGVYFIPCNPNNPTPLSTVTDQLRAAYHPIPSGRWGLEHQLLRETPSCLPPSAYSSPPSARPRSMQLLSLSHYQSHGFIYISNYPNPDPWDAVSSTEGKTAAAPTQAAQGQAVKEAPYTPPSDQQQQQQQQQHQGPIPPAARTMMTLDPQSFASFLSVTRRACEPLWCHRLTLTVSAGVAFSVSDFHIRLGDVRQTQPINRVRGTVVEIEYRGPGTSDGHGHNPDLTTTTANSEYDTEYDDDILSPPPHASQSTSPAKQEQEPYPTDEGWETGAALIREFWSRIATPGAREAILVPGIGSEAREATRRGKRRLTTGGAGDENDGIAGVDLARQYMELFRLNR